MLPGRSSTGSCAVAKERACAISTLGDQSHRTAKAVAWITANYARPLHVGDLAQRGKRQRDCVYVEPDIDYYKDPGAHFLLEVIPNALTRGKSNPRVVYVLRWMAGRHAGVPEFDPLYTIEPA